MQHIVRVCWTATSPQTPRIWRNCRRCGASVAFTCSGKFRVNASGKRIDAWLIYRCVQCDQTWNCPILERALVTAIDPAHLRALSENCGRLAERYAFDLPRLRRYADRIQADDDVAVAARLLSRCDGEPHTLVVSIAVPRPCEMRLDRLLAIGLGLSRAAVQRLHDTAALVVSPPTALCQPVRDGQTVTVDLRKSSQLLSAVLGLCHADPARAARGRSEPWR